MKRLGLSFLLALGLLAGGCSTTSQWENQLEQYRSGRLDPSPDRNRSDRLDLRTDEEKMTAELGTAAGEVAAELAIRSLLVLLAAL